MPITLQDGFIISANFPVDYRFTVTNVSDLSGITKLYVGLKTYVTSVDKTYVYTSTGWKVDSGGSTTNIENNDWTTNIYGSGSVVGDFELFLGTVSNAKNDRSFYYNLWSRGLTDGDQSKILNYFYRNANGNDWDTMAFRIQHQLKPTGGVTRNGAYIEFNPALTASNVPVYTHPTKAIGGLSTIDLIGKNGISLASGDDTNSDYTLLNNTRINISPKNIDFILGNNYNLDNPNPGFINPIGINFHTMSRSDSYVPYTDVVFGFNSKSDSLQRDTISPFRPSYRMRMGSQPADSSGIPGDRNFEKNLWSFDVRAANFVSLGSNDLGIEGSFDEGNWRTVLEINNKKSPQDLNVPSPVKILADKSSADWDGQSPRQHELMYPQDIVRKLEHRYNKIQMWSEGTSFRIVNGTLNGNPYNVLYLSTDGNSFNIELPAGQTLHDILPDKPGATQLDFPVGTIIYITFSNSDKTKPGCLMLYDTPNSKFRSEITEATFYRFDFSKLFIYHTNEFGESITFRRSLSQQTQSTPSTEQPYWSLITINAENRVVRRPFILDSLQEFVLNGANAQHYWDFFKTDGPKTSNTSNPRYLSTLSTTGIWQPLNNTSIINDGISRGQNPAKWNFTNTTTGSPRDQLNPDGFKLRFSVDGNRLVFVQGNFKIDGNNSEIVRSTNTSQNKIFFKSENRKNVWNIGFVFKSEGYNLLLPRFEGNFTKVKMYGTGKRAVTLGDEEITFSNEILSINKDGHIMLEFTAEPTVSGQTTNLLNLKIDVWVPPFSYHANGPTQSFFTS